MAPRAFISCLVATLLFPVFSPAATVKVRILGAPAVQKTLKVEVDSPGEVAVENSLALQTQVIKGQGVRTADLGLVKTPGFYSFRFFTADRSATILVPVLGPSGYVSKPVERPKAQEDVMLKLARLHTKQSVHAAWTNWSLRDQMVENVVKALTAGTLIVVCPFEVVACGPAAETTLDLGLDLFIAFEGFYAEELRKQNKLTAAELQQIKATFQNAKLAKSLFTAKDRWEVAFAGAEYLLDLVTNKDVKISVGLMKDQASKTHTLLMMVKKIEKP
jgi:hypothetical protein